jgi:hypothetical protein
VGGAAVLGRPRGDCYTENMMDEWYCEIDGRRIGPLSPKQLKAMAATGQLLPTDPVRCRESIDWVEAEQVMGLFESPAPPRVIDPPKGLPPALPARDSPKATPILQLSETPPDMMLAKEKAPAQPDAATESFDTPISLHRGRPSALRARSRRKRRMQTVITLCTAIVAVGVVILYLIWATEGIDNPKGEVKKAGGLDGLVAKAVQKPADEKARPPEKRQPARPVATGTSQEPKAAAVNPSINEKPEGGRSEVVMAKPTIEKPAEKPEEKEEPEPPDNEDESKWIDASTMSPAVFDKIQVEVLSAAWEGAEAETPDANRLVISVRVRNTGVAFPVNFTGWSPVAAQQGVSLIDNRQKTVKAKAADAANTVDNLLPIKINPGKSARDVLIFEAPSAKVKYLRLKLSAAAFGKDGTAQFKIPATMIEGTPPSPPKPAAKAAEKVPAPPKPLEKPKKPSGPAASNPKDDFGIDPNAPPPQ